MFRVETAIYYLYEEKTNFYTKAHLDHPRLITKDAHSDLRKRAKSVWVSARTKNRRSLRTSGRKLTNSMTVLRSPLGAGKARLDHTWLCQLFWFE